MPKPRMFVEGEPFASMADFCDWIDAGGWVWWHGRPKHPGFIVGMPFRVVRDLVRGNPHNGLPYIRRAERTKVAA